MNNKILEPDKLENPSQNNPEINYQKLADALRRDMRDASEELLKLRKWLGYVWMILPGDDDQLIKCVGQHIDYALAALDCVDHIKPESDEDASS